MRHARCSLAVSRSRFSIAFVTILSRVATSAFRRKALPVPTTLGSLRRSSAVRTQAAATRWELRCSSVNRSTRSAHALRVERTPGIRAEVACAPLPTPAGLDAAGRQSSEQSAVLGTVGQGMPQGIPQASSVSCDMASQSACFRASACARCRIFNALLQHRHVLVTATTIILLPSICARDASLPHLL